jgi:hypothetical protein
VALLIGALWWHRYATTRPEYTVAQVAVAIRQRDGTKLSYYADGSAVTSQLVDETVDWLVAQRGVDALPADGDGASQGRAARIRSAKTVLNERLDRSIATALMSGLPDTSDVASRVIAELVGQAPAADIMLGDRFDVRSVEPATVQGSTARIPVTLRSSDLTVDVTITLILRREGARWRVVGIGGINRALTIIDNAQLERLTIANRPLERQLTGMLAIGAPSVQRVAHGRLRTVLRLRVPVTNHSVNPVTALTVALETRASDDEHATLLAVQHVIPPGASSTEVWQFDETAERGTRVAAMLTHPESLVLRVRSVVIDSAGQADTVSLLRSYRDVKGRGE